MFGNKAINPQKYFTIVTYGCQMNEHDSEKMTGILESMGYTWTDNKEEADLILYNTCCVRKHAEERVYGNIGMLKDLKQRKPDVILGVCGCMMQQKGVAQEMKKRFPFIDLIFGTFNLHNLPKLLEEVSEKKETVIEILDDQGRIYEDVPVKRKKGVSAWVTIMYGCNNFCSYCIVPYVRGRERSRHPDNIIKEVEKLGREGVKEIILLGQNVNSYGKDLEGKITFSRLLRKLDQIENIKRIRFMTSHPKDLSEDLILTIRDCQRVCNQLHLPIQSGSSNILKKMNRNYTREEYLNLVRRIRKEIPDIGLSTDIIVGFPGETDKDFSDTVDLIKQVKFDSAFMFAYSKRTGTPAARMGEQIDEETKKRRLEQLIKIQNAISKEKNMLLKNKTVEVLVEGLSKNNKNVLTGRTDTGKIVNFTSDVSLDKLYGKIVKVRITHPKSWSLTGEMISAQ
ncbi:MAG TPA: tRNA (N6-isopentenyl adenosine(37)-C2)-methylthiotransferase MiaB [Clostridiales bacterium]|nr:tRNA (N6-isopentenyl adenosine(37)-C2)-methylthiotransferase MiaB [Clostridiales bacterium]